MLGITQVLPRFGFRWGTAEQEHQSRLARFGSGVELVLGVGHLWHVAHGGAIAKPDDPDVDVRLLYLLSTVFGRNLVPRREVLHVDRPALGLLHSPLGGYHEIAKF